MFVHFGIAKAFVPSALRPRLQRCVFFKSREAYYLNSSDMLPATTRQYCGRAWKLGSEFERALLLVATLALHSGYTNAV